MAFPLQRGLAPLALDCSRASYAAMAPGQGGSLEQMKMHNFPRYRFTNPYKGEIAENSIQKYISDWGKILSMCINNKVLGCRKYKELTRINI